VVALVPAEVEQPQYSLLRPWSLSGQRCGDQFRCSRRFRLCGVDVLSAAGHPGQQEHTCDERCHWRDLNRPPSIDDAPGNTSHYLFPRLVPCQRRRLRSLRLDSINRRIPAPPASTSLCRTHCSPVRTSHEARLINLRRETHHRRERPRILGPCCDQQIVHPYRARTVWLARWSHVAA
jgi:hypothetical protein